MTTRKQSLGRWGEEAAAKYLVEHGYTILARNVRTRQGEIDLIAEKEGATIFVEVKTRTSTSFAYPEDSVTPRKQARMMAVAERYLQEHECGETWQFDIIAIETYPDGKAVITHFENVAG